MSNETKDFDVAQYAAILAKMDARLHLTDAIDKLAESDWDQFYYAFSTVSGLIDLWGGRLLAVEKAKRELREETHRASRPKVYETVRELEQAKSVIVRLREEIRVLTAENKVLKIREES